MNKTQRPRSVRQNPAPRPWPICSGRSDVLRETAVPKGQNPRDYYLAHPEQAEPPYISRSPFVPDAFVTHLMRDKKDSALGVKFVPHTMPQDSITNMEGALHTFVTPVVPAALHGDYRFDRGHKVRAFAPRGHSARVQTARDVLVSAMVHPDFETDDVMLRACALGPQAIEGRAWPTDALPIDPDAKQDARTRATYDAHVRAHLVAHLTQAQRLPALADVGPNVWSIDDSVHFLDEAIEGGHAVALSLENLFVSPRAGAVLSCEMLFRTALEQVRNELMLLEAICPQGYVYTYDPPAIFAERLDARLTTRLHLAALACVSNTTRLARMRAYGFNDYADAAGVPLCRAALTAQPHVHVAAKSALFCGPHGAYQPGPWGTGAMLVVHNNSDAFGQNIETEGDFASMDGAIGAHSSAAASLLRKRGDLLSRLG